jgi:hypothetical protein
MLKEKIETNINGQCCTTIRYECPFGYKIGIDWAQYRKYCRQECHGGCSMKYYIACRDLRDID